MLIRKFFITLIFLVFTVNANLACSFLDSLDSVLIPGEISVKHTEGRGLGYTMGYTSFDLLLAAPLSENTIVPFVDLRGHIFNNTRHAYNAGVGVRFLNLFCEEIWGINCFYDTYDTWQLNYKQVGFGFEVLSDAWEARINAYFPVGRKKTNIYLIDYHLWSGFWLKTQEQFAMTGVDSEFGYHFFQSSCFDLYAALGPYYYSGNSSRTKNLYREKNEETFGGRARIAASFLTYFELEGIGTYDSHFNWTGQAIISLNIPFGCFAADCNLWEKLFQRVWRNEIIVVNKMTRYTSDPFVLDPETPPK